MSKLRIFYILSLVILGLLLVSTVFRPMATSGGYSEVSREQLLQAEDEWIVQFDIINREGKDQRYTIGVSVDVDKPYKENVLIPDGRMFTYIHHIYKHQITEGEVSFVLYKEGEDTPFEEITYYLE